ncbi:PREDICTED: B-lymphocyte antigen CD20 isoform X2 [Chinchilla lanigera]|uniref:B-lymphocyte antigen CD20 isoform X2 n=1 Tax=Chinchilla lanigera TaxID=34839 RepID=UPI00038EBB77|nr:PREDICTED: B-lymphocyte antigen CD20 isoform X2 [Chinchilla lanigera]
MTTPRNSVSGTFPAEPPKGPISMQPANKVSFQRVPAVGPTQSFFMRESKALGAIQIMNGLFHMALGGLLMIPTGAHGPICVAVWYPLWGGIMFIISGSFLVATEKTSRKSLIRVKVIMNSLTLFAAISGIILLIMDILNIKLSHFLKMERLILIKTPVPYIDIYNCEAAGSSDENFPSTQYCYNIQSVFLKLVAAGIVENEWKRLCSRPKASVVLLSAEDKKEQTAEIKEEMVELIEVSSQPKPEEEIEIIPVQEEEEETEANFPEPPQDQESSPVENDNSP